MDKVASDKLDQKIYVLYYAGRWRKLFIGGLIISTVMYLFVFYQADIIDKVWLVILLIMIFLYLKGIESLLVNKIVIDAESKTVSFYRTFGKIVLTSADIEWWGIRQAKEKSFYNSLSDYAGTSTNYYFESKFKNGNEFMYPVPHRQYDLIKHLPELFEKALLIPPTELESYNQGISIASGESIKRGLIFWWL